MNVPGDVTMDELRAEWQRIKAGEPGWSQVPIKPMSLKARIASTSFDLLPMGRARVWWKPLSDPVDWCK